MKMPRTPHHTTGPFFPAGFVGTAARDLTHGSSGSPRGEVVELRGEVRDALGGPAVNVIIELWQADAGGIFNHPLDPRFASRDPHFRGWGRTWTDEAGRFLFRTIKPGAYPSLVDPEWVRPPHLSLTVLGSGIMRPLVAQLFFPEEPLNATDRQLLAVEPSRRHRLLLSPVPNADPPGAVFGVTLVLGGGSAEETPFFTD
jgi:protocatechuate 3,4-dioxygenase beta subunit